MPNVLSRLRRCAADFSSDRSGGIVILVALALIPLVGAVGLAFDAGRAYMVRNKLAYAVDAAGLAAAEYSATPDTAADVFEKYFDANFPSDYLGATNITPNFTVSEDGEVLTIGASATIDTTLMNVLGKDTMEVVASAQVTKAATNAHIVFSFDLSGSMSQSAGGGLHRSHGVGVQRHRLGG